MNIEMLGILAMAFGVLATASRPQIEGWLRRRQKKEERVEKPMRGETWTNDWGFSATMRGFSPDGNMILSVSLGGPCTEDIAIGPENWTQFVQEHSLERPVQPTLIRN